MKIRRSIGLEDKVQRPGLHVSIREFSDVMSSRIAYYEEAGNWRNIIFLPFNMTWKILVMLTTVVNFNLVAYIMIFEEKQDSLTSTAYYIFEGIYFINTSLSLLHRSMRYRRTRSHAPKNVYLLTIDVLSLMPYYEVYYLLTRTSYGVDHNFADDYTRIKVFPRIFAVISFFINTDNEPGLNHLLSMTVLQLVCYSLFCVSLSGIWYTVGRHYRPRGWTRNLHHYNFDSTSRVHWWVICNTFASGIFFHVVSGILAPTSLVEYLIILIAMFVAFLFHIFFYCNLMSLYIKHITDQYYFSYRLFVIKNLLDKWLISSTWKKPVVQVYNVFLEKRFGRSKMPSAFYKCLPLTLQKEVNLDTFWHFFRHSHFFNDTDVVFNRNLCLSMKCQYYTAGEFLYTKGELKNKIVYIVSGVIQLLSMDDQNSPVISFSSGTVLGEICCLMSVESNSYLRCATYCEIQVLELRTLAYDMAKYPYVSKILWQKLNARLSVARRHQHPELIRLKSKEEKRTSIRWFKSQWRLIADLAKQAKRTYDGRDIPIVPYHFSKFLNLYVLSDEVELKVRAICLRSECPFVLDPRNKFKLCCDYIILFVVFIQAVYLPYYIVFIKSLTIGQIGLFYTLDVFYYAGLYIDISTAVKTKDRLITNICDIIVYKGKQIAIMIDIAATIPLEAFAGMISEDYQLANLLHLNRVLKIYRLIYLVHSTQSNDWVNYTRLRIFKYCLLYLLILYYFACILYGIVCFWECKLTGWYLYNKILRALLTSDKIEFPSAFLSSLHRVAPTLFATPWKIFFPYSILDMVLEQIIANMGYFLVSFCFAEMGACAVMYLKNQYDFKEHINLLKFFSQRKNLSEKLIDIMYKATDCHWMYTNGYNITGKKNVVKHLPVNIRNAIVTSRVINCLKVCPLFKGCDDKVLLQVASRCKIQICPPDMIISRADCKPSHLFIILNGYCKIESSFPTDKYHEMSTTISFADCFPCLEALMRIDNFIIVTSITHVEIMTIDTNELLKVFEHYSDMYDDFMRILNQLFQENETVLSRRKGRLPDMVSSQPSKGKAEYFKYRCVDGEETDEMDYNAFYSAFSVLGRWKFIRHVFLRKTIEPTSTFYLRWEIGRCVMSILYVVYIFTLVKYCLLHNTHHYVEIFYVVLGLVDFYIRMHVRYYNDIGIIVTHPLYTAAHYIGTSFTLDLIGIFPIYTLSIHGIFGKSRRLHTLVLMTVVTKPLLLCKVIKGISYLQSLGQEAKNLFYENLKYLIAVLLIVGIAALALEGFTCTGEKITGKYSCKNDSWIISRYFTEKYETYTPTLISYYVAFSLLNSSTLGTFEFLNAKDMWMILILTIIMFGLRWYILTKITSIWIGGNKMLVQYQHNIKIFMLFSKYYRLTNNIVSETVAHYEHQWKTSKGCNIFKVLSTLHPVLRGDFYQFLYEKYLLLSEIFYDANQSIIRYVTAQCHEIHFKKDSIIIHCNDINNILYIVCKGQVDISIANYSLCVLSTGGIFGCLMPHGATRQTITARSLVHTTLLAIKSDKFTELLQHSPKYLARMKKHVILSNEFLHSRSDIHAHQALWRSSKPKINLITLSRTLTLRKKYRFLIFADKTWYPIYSYIINVHLSVWSSVIVSLMIIRAGIFDKIMHFYNYLYIFDIIYWTKLIFHFHLTYYDKETGILVTNHTYITKRYLKSWRGFWLDLFTSFPFEIFVAGFNNNLLFRLFWLNRTVRFVFFFVYYRASKKRLTITKLQRWTYLMYIMIIIMHFATCTWWSVACHKHICTIVRGNTNQGFGNVYIKKPEYGYLTCFYHVINIFTGTGLKHSSPKTLAELIAMIITVCASQLTTVVLMVSFSNMILLQKFMMNEYERKAKHILLFMKATNVSRSLLNKVWNYFSELWVRGYGSWLPEMIRDSPNYLKQQIMSELYGQYLSKSCLFKDTHVDFLRQLVMYLEPNEFVPGMYIVEKGDIDACMYFIQKGEVIVYDKHGNNEIEQTSLAAGDSFGELQGIYGTPHDRSYKARFHCQILILHKYHWNKLLKWFPASKQRIDEAISNCFKKPDSFAPI